MAKKGGRLETHYAFNCIFWRLIRNTAMEAERLPQGFVAKRPSGYGKIFAIVIIRFLI
jgi:hypothetical protein